VSLFRKKNINIPTDTTADKNGNKKLNVTFERKKKNIHLYVYVSTDNAVVAVVAVVSSDG